jgi:DNA-binding MarR family transcriptional regulator
MKHPETIDEFLAFRLYNLSKLAARGAGIVLRREFNLSRRDWRILAYVAQGQDMSLTELAEVAELDTVVVSRGVAKLVARGLIAKRRMAANKRLLVLSLSPSGQILYERARRRTKMYNADFAACLSARQASVLDTLLLKLASRATELVAREATKSARGGPAT